MMCVVRQQKYRDSKAMCWYQSEISVLLASSGYHHTQTSVGSVVAFSCHNHGSVCMTTESTETTVSIVTLLGPAATTPQS